MGSRDCLNLTVTTDTLTCNPPGQSAVGDYAIVVTTSAGSFPTAPQVVNLYYLDKPTITSVSPTPVPSTTATIITLTGTNFDNISSAAAAANVVEIGGQPCTIVSIDSDTQLRCTSPANIAAGGTQFISIETLAGKYVADGDGGRTDVEVVFQNAPDITGISPASGPVAGNTKVTVTASDICFNNASIIDGATLTKGANATSVFNAAVTASVNCTSNTGISGGTLDIYTPASITGAGAADISVSTTVGDSSNTAADDFTYMNTPGITSFLPLAVSVSGKAIYTDPANGTLTINGSNFDDNGVNLVYINNVLCPSTGTDTTSQLQCTIPASTISGNGAGTDLEVKVVTHGDTVTIGGTGNLDGFTYLPAPTIASISPARSVINQSRTVTISGTYFDAITGNRTTTTSTAVTIGSGNCSDVTVIDASTLTCKTPAMTAVGLQSVTVSTLAGSDTLLSGGFTYQAMISIDSISPIAGSKQGGTVIHITGEHLDNFDNADGDFIKIDGNECTNYNVTSATNIDCTVPAGTPGMVDVVLDTVAGGDTLVDAYVYLDNPALSSVTPYQGPIGGSTYLAIVGQNFDDFNDPSSTKFFFDGAEYTMVNNLSAPGQCSVVSDTLANCLNSDHAAGSINITSTTDSVAAPTSLSYLYANTPGWLKVSPNYGPITGGTEITITGVNGSPSPPAINDIFSVTVGTIACTVTFVGVNIVKCTTPAASQAGWATVQTQTVAGIHPEFNAFNYLDVPTINTTSNKPSPNHGKENDEVTITGTNFDLDFDATPEKGTGTSVFRFDGEEAHCTVNSTTVATCKVPDHPGGATYLYGTPNPIDITLTTGYSTSAVATAPAAFDYMPVPVVYYPEPSTGSLVAANKEFTIWGSGFDRDVASGMGYGSTSVTIDGKACLISAIDTYGTYATTITCALAADATDFDSPGDKAVAVTTAGGITSVNAYTVLPLPVVSGLSDKYVAANTNTQLITINGSGFTWVTEIYVGSLNVYPHSVNIVSTSRIDVLLPNLSKQTVDVKIVSYGGTSVLSENSKLDYMDRPTISSVVNNASPTNSYGPANQTQTIKITGENFKTTSNTGSISVVQSVKVGGANCGDISAASDTELTCLAPSLAAGPKAIVVASTTGQNSGNDGANAYSYVALPRVTQVSPNMGPNAGGASQNITLSGDNFIDVTDVTFNGTSVGAGNFTVNTSSNPVTISVQAPASTATAFPSTVNVGVVAVGGTSTNNGANDDYTYQAAPTLSAIEPALANSSAKSVKLTGTGFVSNNTTVSVEGESADISLTAITGTTELSFAMPAKANNSRNYTVTVTTPGGTSTAIIYEVLAVPTITAVSPSSGSPSGGTLVTVTGANFFRANNTTNAITKVTLDGVELTGTAAPTAPTGDNSSASFDFIAPAHGSGGTYHIRVTTAGGESEETSADEFSYSDPPEITSVEDAATGGNVVKYVKSGDVVYVFAQQICQASVSNLLSSGGAVVSANSTDTPATVNSVTCTSATDGYVELTMPTSPLSKLDMTTPYYVRLETSNGINAVGAVNMVIYPPEPILSSFDNSTYGALIGTTTSTTPGVVLTGENFKIATAGDSLIKSITVYELMAQATPKPVTVIDATSTTSITVTIPSGLSVGAHVIAVETYGGSAYIGFNVLAQLTITWPTSASPAYMWTDDIIATGKFGPEPFSIEGSGFASDTEITIEGAAPETGSCNYINAASITGCDINRSDAKTPGTAEAAYSLTAKNPLTGFSATVERAIRLEQISPASYDFVGGLGTGTEFVCSDLVYYNFPNPNPTTYHTAIVNDTRNSQSYRVRRLADGNCYMIDNLKLVGSLPLTSADTDISGNWTLPGFTAAGARLLSTASYIYNINDVSSRCTSSSVAVTRTYYSSHSISKCGFLYNFPAAVGNTGFAGSGLNTTYGTSVCPKGWSLPAIWDYSALNTAMISAGAPYSSTQVSNWLPSGAFSGTLSGQHYDYATNGPGTGYLWSATAGSNSNGLWVQIQTSALTMHSYGNLGADRGFGNSVRCYQ